KTPLALNTPSFTAWKRCGPVGCRLAIPRGATPYAGLQVEPGEDFLGPCELSHIRGQQRGLTLYLTRIIPPVHGLPVSSTLRTVPLGSVIYASQVRTPAGGQNALSSGRTVRVRVGHSAYDRDDCPTVSARRR